ncbi:T9SS type A sorting domain-containing protein [Marixanthomonas ophiurae]|uniref:T9SS C-terminal target domain-containing protein n=1 Tax=Marixanthomonas ophiurae TaxID=387659 RepID=A0A3E1QCH8_9FLAO|nr:T9SS type A sorting domain-containing protein [Marixanthomonas ophiurae]RFN59804.1 T9SS C-terminal target domain-containing protein [Marixanthomonas ophiurae]
MKAKLLINLFLIGFIFQIQAQTDPNWTYIRTDNTGIGGQLHYTIKGDAFNNIWTGGYTSSVDEGSLVRIATNDTVYTNWGTYAENYLPNGLIFDIEFDHTGVIWVATEKGIATSGDGLDWQHYDTANSSLLADQTEGMAIGLNDDLWAVTTNADNSINGVGFYNGTLWEYYTSSNSGLPAGTRLNDIAIDESDIKWVASENGLIKYDGVDWTQYTTANSGLSSNNILEIVIDNQDKVWALVGNAVDIFDGTDWTHITSDDLPVSNLNASSIAIRDDKIILTEGSNSRALIFDGTDWTVETINYSIFDCYIDTDGNYWISGSGVVGKFDGVDWTRFTRNNTGLPDNFNDDIFIDSQGRRWFANGQGGIQVFDCPNWEVYGPNNEGLFPNPQPLFQTTIGTSITEDGDGDIWFTYDGTSGYAIQIPDGNYSDYASWVIWDNTNSHSFLQSLQEIEATDNGLIFTRAYNGNTFMYDKAANTWTLWDFTNGLTGNPNCLTGRTGGKMYLGQYQGIDIYDNGTWSRMDLSSQGIEHISDIQFDNNDIMWVATTEGLWKYDGTDWTNWNSTNSNIAADNVRAIDIDANNNIYISAHNTQTAPYYGGISYFDGTGDTFTTFLDASSPLAHKQVEDIEVDEFGNIWALTQSEGFSIYNPNGITGFECIDRSLNRILSVPTVGSESLDKGISYPNPFSVTTTIVFNSNNVKPVSIVVYDLLGRKIKSVLIEDVSEGKNTFTLNLSDQSTGIYFCKITSNKKSSTIKLLKK